jgi:Ca2+-binding RTX toxin-like protein
MARILGSPRSDTLSGTTAGDEIIALGSDDLLEGRAGPDAIRAGRGDDTAFGDEGSPVFPVLPGGDDTIDGGPGDDTLFGGQFTGGGDGDNLVLGGRGDDQILAGWGADTVFGGPGNDVITGYGIAFGIPFNAFTMVLQRESADLLSGNAGADSIDGGGGADTLLGGAGPDTLTGGYDADLFIGGPGADAFQFGPVMEPFILARPPLPDTGVGEGERDVVADFRQGRDLLDLSGYAVLIHVPSGQVERSEPVFLGSEDFTATFTLQVRTEQLPDDRTLVQFAAAPNFRAPEEGDVPTEPASPTGEIELAGNFALTQGDFLL